MKTMTAIFDLTNPDPETWISFEDDAKNSSKEELKKFFADLFTVINEDFYKFSGGLFVNNTEETMKISITDEKDKEGFSYYFQKIPFKDFKTELFLNLYKFFKIDKI